MGDVLKNIRIGIVNLLGITLPGLIGCYLLISSVILPFVTLRKSFNFDKLVNYKIELWIVILVAAYIIGYVIRLKDMHLLDKVSAIKLWKKGKRDVSFDVKENPKKKGKYEIPDDDRYPYQNFKDRLDFVGLGDLKKFVTWNSNVGNDTKYVSRGSINLLKQYIAFTQPVLYETIDSIEAHIRLIFGIWVISVPGIVLSGIGIGLTVALKFAGSWLPAYHPSVLRVILMSLPCVFNLIGLVIARRIIVNTFHYTRRSELYRVLGAAYLCEQTHPDIKLPTEKIKAENEVKL